jgi:transposase
VWTPFLRTISPHFRVSVLPGEAQSLSSVKRYVQRAEGGGSLAPKEKPGAVPKLNGKAMKLLQEDLNERPFATLRERCEYIGVLTGVWVSRSTMCRAIARIGPTREKGGA